MPSGADDGPSVPPEPTRVVADADVLAADLLVGGAAREALDLLRGHSWLELVVSASLLADAEAVICDLGGAALAADWRTRIDTVGVHVEPTMRGHPALTAAAAGAAATVLSFDATLRSASTGAAIRPTVATSVKSPTAFTQLLDPADLYETVKDGAYPGPDRDPHGRPTR